ncbi:MAG: hypothetical protein N3B21_19500 [Clostridia bacterium]|nr:hypothetical protein [Clostridia bacterium]
MEVLAMQLCRNTEEGMKIQYKFLDVHKETETAYKLVKAHTFTNNRATIRKDEVDKIQYNETLERRNCKNCDFSYVHLTVWILIESDAHKYELLRYWRTQIKNKAMEELKNRNQFLKEMYNEIASL